MSMRIIICGAGQVGMSIARQLASEGNDVIVIDKSEELIKKISDTLDVQAMVGYASHPEVLHRAGAKDVDMIIAVTFSDEVNMVACQVAHSLFNIPIKIARIRHQNYLKDLWRDLYRQDHLPIDYIISPEIEVGKAILHRLHVPGSMDTIPFVEGKVKVIGIKCLLDCPMIHMPIAKIYSQLVELNVSILGLLRESRFIVPDEYEQLLPGDEIYLAVDNNHVRRTMVLFGHEEEEARRVVIIGGGNIGLFIAQHLEEEEEIGSVKIIEVGEPRAREIVDYLEDTTVIAGSALEQEILEEANIANTETVIAVTNDDKVNILSSLLSKRFGCDRVVTLINRSNSYAPLVSSLGIDTIVSPRETTVSSILRYVRRGSVRSVFSICEGLAEVIETVVMDRSPVADKVIGELPLPESARIGVIVRGEQVIIPDDEMVIRKGDHIILISQSGSVKKVEKTFCLKQEFF